MWPAHVYCLQHQGDVLYVGKGTTKRLHNQIRHFALVGYEVARFKREKDAYKFERELIAELQPRLNQHPGGNGSWANPRRQYTPAPDDRDAVSIFAISILIKKCGVLRDDIGLVARALMMYAVSDEAQEKFRARIGDIVSRRGFEWTDKTFRKHGCALAPPKIAIENNGAFNAI